MYPAANIGALLPNIVGGDAHIAPPFDRNASSDCVGGGVSDAPDGRKIY